MLDTEEEISFVATVIGSVISLIFSGFIVYMYTVKSDLKSYACKFIRYLCISDCLLAICNFYLAFMFPSYLFDWLCIMQSILITYFLLSSIL